MEKDGRIQCEVMLFLLCLVKRLWDLFHRSNQRNLTESDWECFGVGALSEEEDAIYYDQWL